jgi:ribose-phosphate pyrophosphokinase
VRVIAVATHGVFAGEANAVLAASPIDRLIVTDTIAGPRLSDPALLARIDRIPVAPLLADAIGSLSPGVPDLSG